MKSNSNLFLRRKHLNLPLICPVKTFFMNEWTNLSISQGKKIILRNSLRIKPWEIQKWKTQERKHRRENYIEWCQSVKAWLQLLSAITSSQKVSLAPRHSFQCPESLGFFDKTQKPYWGPLQSIGRFCSPCTICQHQRTWHFSSLAQRDAFEPMLK